MNTATVSEAPDLTAVGVRDLFNRYGGWLNDRERHALDELLRVMTLDADIVADARAWCGDIYYKRAVDVLKKMLRFQALGKSEMGAAPGRKRARCPNRNSKRALGAERRR